MEGPRALVLGNAAEQRAGAVQSLLYRGQAPCEAEIRDHWKGARKVLQNLDKKVNDWVSDHEKLGAGGF